MLSGFEQDSSRSFIPDVKQKRNKNEKIQAEEANFIRAENLQACRPYNQHRSKNIQSVAVRLTKTKVTKPAIKTGFPLLTAQLLGQFVVFIHWLLSDAAVPDQKHRTFPQTLSIWQQPSRWLFSWLFSTDCCIFFKK